MGNNEQDVKMVDGSQGKNGEPKEKVLTPFEKIQKVEAPNKPLEAPSPETSTKDKAAEPQKETEKKEPEKPKELEKEKLEKVEVNEFKTKYDTELPPLKAEVEKLQGRLQDWEKDPILALRKHRPEVLENLEAAINPDAYIQKWQKEQLFAELKKQFPETVADDWRFDANEAYEAGTPSYTYRVRTEEKRQSLVSSQQSQRVREQQVIDAYSKQRDVDLKFISETYGFDENAMKGRLQAFDSVHQQVTEGKVSAEKHPLALRNLMRGFFFDELVAIHEKKAVEKAMSELKELYKSKGITLPELQPTDVTKPRETTNPPPDEGLKKKLSPLKKTMAGYTQ